MSSQKFLSPALYKTTFALGLGLSLSACSKAESSAPAPSKTETHAASFEETQDAAETVSEPHKDHDEHADESDDHVQVRSAKSHIHGGAALSIISNNNRLEIEFETPLFNLLGFEYAPRTQAEKTLVLETQSSLSDPQTLIHFNKDAKCVFDTPTSEIELFDADLVNEAHDDHHEENDDHHDHHDDDEHHDEHKEDHHDEHKEDHHDDEHKGEDNHKDVVITYSANCEAIDKLKTIRVNYFKTFSNFTELELVYLGPSRQMSAELTPSKPSANLAR